MTVRGSSYFRRALLAEPGLKEYVDSITGRGGLDVIEEKTLSRRACQGDPAARARLIEQNLLLSVSVGKNYMGLGLSALDIIAAGNVGLIVGIDHYNPSKSRARLATYVSPWVRAYIVRAMRANDPIELPYDVYLARLRIDRVKAAHDDLTMSEVIELARVKPSELRRVEAAPKVAPYNAVEVEAVEAQDDIAAAVERSETRAFIEAGILCLPRRMQFIIRASTGLNDENAVLSYEAIGRFLGISDTRVKQIEAVAIKRLRTFLAPRLAQVS